jgi:hypothetical protein
VVCWGLTPGINRPHLRDQFPGWIIIRPPVFPRQAYGPASPANPPGLHRGLSRSRFRGALPDRTCFWTSTSSRLNHSNPVLAGENGWLKPANMAPKSSKGRSLAPDWTACSNMAISASTSPRVPVVPLSTTPTGLLPNSGCIVGPRTIPCCGRTGRPAVQDFLFGSGS